MPQSHLNQQTTVEPTTAIVTRRRTTPPESKATQIGKLAFLELESLQYSARAKIGQQAMKHFEDRDLRLILLNVGVLDQVDQELGRIQYAQYISSARFSKPIKQQSPLRQAEPIELPQVKVAAVEIQDDELPKLPLHLPLPEYPSFLPPPYYDEVLDDPSDSNSGSDSDPDSDSDIDGKDDEDKIEHTLSLLPSQPSSESISVSMKTVPYTRRFSPFSLPRRLRSCVSKAGSTVPLKTNAAPA